MVHGFLELTTYPAHEVCVIFEDFVPIVGGLDGLVLGSNYKTLCFEFQPSCIEPSFCPVGLHLSRLFGLGIADPFVSLPIFA